MIRILRHIRLRANVGILPFLQEMAGKHVRLGDRNGGLWDSAVDI
jgi:hypothetical protein